MKRQALSSADMQAITCNGARHTRRIMKQHDHFYIDGRGRAGKQLRVYLDSLPEWMQERWQEIRIAQLAAWQLEEQTRRLKLIEKAIAIEDEAVNGRVKTGLKRLCKRNEISCATLKRWRRIKAQQGAAALAPNHNTKKVLTKQVKTFIVEYWNQQSRPGVNKTQRKTNIFCEKNGFELVSRYQVQRVIDAIPEPEKALGRYGKRAQREQFGFYIVRDWSEIAVNALWCGDHRQFDIFVLYNKVSEKPIRPWLTLWEDMRTRAITGFTICRKPNSDSIALALKDGIRRYGQPEAVYIDNGKDYRSYYFSGHQSRKFKVDLDDRTQYSITSRLGIKIHHALPYHPESKPAESLFKFVSLEFDPDLPGWCGRDNTQKPEKLDSEMKSGNLMTLDELRAKFAKWVKWYNREWVHKETRRTPQSIYDGVKIVQPDRFVLDTMLMKREDKKLRRNGFRLMNEWYWHDRFTRMKYEKDVYTVAWDPSDVSHIHVFDGARHICTAKPLGKVLPIGTSERDMQRLKRIQKEERELQKEFFARRVHKLTPIETLEQMRAEDCKPEPIEPVHENILTIVTPESKIAKQIVDANQNIEAPEYRKTGTDNSAIFGYVPPKPPKKKALLFFEDFLKDVE